MKWRRGREVIRHLHGGQIKVTIILGERSASVTFESGEIEVINTLVHAAQWNPSNDRSSTIDRTPLRFTTYVPREKFSKRGDPIDALVTSIERVLNGEQAIVDPSEASAKPQRQKEEKPPEQSSPWDRLDPTTGKIQVSLNGRDLILEVAQQTTRGYAVRIKADPDVLVLLLRQLEHSGATVFMTVNGLMVGLRSKAVKRDALKQIATLIDVELLLEGGFR